MIPCTEADLIISDAAIAIENGRITAAGPRAEVLAGAPSDASRVDLDGSFIIPGLWDSHIHLGAYVPPYDQAFEHEKARSSHDPVHPQDAGQPALRHHVAAVAGRGKRR